MKKTKIDREGKTDVELKYERFNRYWEEFYRSKAPSEENIEGFIAKYLESNSRSSFYTNIRVLNMILDEKKLGFNVDQKDYKKYIKVRDEKYLTKKEVQLVCNMIENPQDAFIVYALWNGIMGKRFDDLRNLKVEDVAKDNSYIRLPNRIFYCDNFMKELIKITKEQYMITIETKTGAMKYYELNMDSPYLLKVRPKSNNGDGLRPMAINSIQQKLIKISEKLTEENDNINIDLNALNLVKSGILYKMFEMESKEGVVWTVSSMEEYVARENLKVNVPELYRVFSRRYHGTDTL